MLTPNARTSSDALALPAVVQWHDIDEIRPRDFQPVLIAGADGAARVAWLDFVTPDRWIFDGGTVAISDCPMWAHIPE